MSRAVKYMTAIPEPMDQCPKPANISNLALALRIKPEGIGRCYLPEQI